LRRSGKIGAKRLEGKAAMNALGSFDSQKGVRAHDMGISSLVMVSFYGIIMV
jgi:hypothetical protein